MKQNINTLKKSRINLLSTVEDQWYCGSVSLPKGPSKMVRVDGILWGGNLQEYKYIFKKKKTKTGEVWQNNYLVQFN